MRYFELPIKHVRQSLPLLGLTFLVLSGTALADEPSGLIASWSFDEGLASRDQLVVFYGGRDHMGWPHPDLPKRDRLGTKPTHRQVDNVIADKKLRLIQSCRGLESRYLPRAIPS